MIKPITRTLDRSFGEPKVRIALTANVWAHPEQGDLEDATVKAALLEAHSVLQRHLFPVTDMPAVSSDGIPVVGLTDAELRLIEQTANLWDDYLELLKDSGDEHPMERVEMARDIHDIQQRVMARCARRAHPTVFR